MRLGGAAHAVDARAEELVEDVVLVGGQHETTDRQAHRSRDVAGADVAEVAGRHGEVDDIVVARRRLEVPGEVVHDLSQQTGPVDRVDGADRVATLEAEVGRDRLDEILAIVEDAVDGDVVDVRLLQAEHLRLLERAHPAERRQHEDLDAALAFQGVLGGAAGVARCRAQDVEPAAAARELVLEGLADELHRDVLERERRAVRQAEHEDARLERPQRHDARVAEDVGAVGSQQHRAQVVGRDVVDEARQHREGELGIRELAPRSERRRVDGRVALGNVEAAVGREPFEQDRREPGADGLAARADVLHGRAGRTPRAVTPDLPCGCARSPPAPSAAPASARARPSSALRRCRG